MGIAHTLRSGTLLAAGLIACSSSSGSVAVSADQAAGDAAHALCARYDACSTFFIQLEYGSVDACAAALKTSLAGALAASGTGATPAQVESCSSAVAGASCDDVIGHNLPPSCQPVAGHLASGAACGDASQCTTAYCHKGANTTCGACGDAPAAGASCTSNDDCIAGNVCTKGGTCTAPGAAGASCDAEQHPCKATLACKSGACATPDVAGASCTKTMTGTFSSDSCDSLAGLYCNAQGTCVQIGLASAGQPCLLVNGALTVCSGNGTCNVPTRLSTSGACLAAAAPGATCTAKSRAGFDYAVSSADCAFPATCQSGVCTVPDAASCH